MNRHDDFYVGYATAVPPALRRHVVRIVLGVNALAVLLAVLLVAAQSRFPASAFEYQVYRDFEGSVEEFPYPNLIVPRPGAGPGSVPFSRYWLVAPGKHGASKAVEGLDGKKARVAGALIYRDGDTAIEMAPGSAPSLAGPDSTPAGGPVELGAVELTGEIVDSKCYFGVMNPGAGKVHRDCAARCISGGIPPVLIVSDSRGAFRTLVLTGPNGRRLNREVLDFVAEPVLVKGLLVRSGETYFLRAGPGSFARAGGGRNNSEAAGNLLSEERTR